jgi:hypothetical protein
MIYMGYAWDMHGTNLLLPKTTWLNLGILQVQLGKKRRNNWLFLEIRTLILLIKMIPIFIENNWDQPCYLIWTQCLISTNRLGSAQMVDGNFSIFPQVIRKITNE